ncbi:hypothetical protein BP6252_06543 [Coleophoma cylindrospora]|uniref:Xylanolytic transcriptional activator regulatory domain-containing protein n=1 Tax=Coleophoma cylindrospora TaxID=1849047 RepID=A0A3D8RNL5_9HELO|nr:hypothetical protein BP6252_06543 [Coleophoma cylindrospora]
MYTSSTHHNPSTQQEAQQKFSRRPYRSKRNRPCTLCRSRKISYDASSCRPASCVEVPGPGGREGEQAITTPNSDDQAAPTTLGEAQYFRWSPNDEVSGQVADYGSFNDGEHMNFYGRAQDLLGVQESEANSAPWLSSTVNSSALEGGLVPNSMEDISIGNLGDLFPLPNNSLGMPSLSRQPTAGSGPDMASPEDRGSEPKTIDQRAGFHSSYFGLSGECDPYLLRHVMYDESNEKPFLKLWYRSLASGLRDPDGHAAPLISKSQKISVPVQFMLMSKPLVEEVRKVGPVVNLPHSRSELDEHVRPDHGNRLILLFVEYVFPALPVISRSQLARSTLSFHQPRSQKQELIPTYLLAAIYASALEFGSYDDVLCLSSLYRKPSAERLWQMVYEGVQADMHSPSLATLSASLLYLHKRRTGIQNISVDTPFTWTFTASTIALTTTLGLHLDCASWKIPPWEKRLRRRLWWMSFSEEKWRSLLLGRPSIIARDQWNVSELADSDFEMDDIGGLEPDLELPPEVKTFFRALESSGKEVGKAVLSQQIASLSLIADSMYTDLYTIRAAQSLGDDFKASMRTIRPLRERLALWYSRLPATLQSPKKASSDTFVPLVPNSVACLHFAYVTLEVLLYRALLRPLGNVDLGNDMTEPQLDHQARNIHSTGIADSSQPNMHDDPSTLGFSDQDLHGSFLNQAEAVINAAETCAKVVTTFTAELMSWDFAGFWYSSVVTNGRFTQGLG